MLPSRMLGFKGRRLPKFKRIGRLHVVVAVAQNGRFAGRVQPVGIHQRMTAGRYDFDVFHAGLMERICHETSCPRDVVLVFGQSADAGYAQAVVIVLRENAARLRQQRSRQWRAIRLNPTLQVYGRVSPRPGLKRPLPPRADSRSDGPCGRLSGRSGVRSSNPARGREE